MLGTSIAREIIRIQASVRKAMVRSLLKPSTSFVVMIDIVAISAASVALEEGPLNPKARVIPIVLKATFSGYAQDANYPSQKPVFLTSTTDNNVPQLRGRTYLRLARCKRANTVERVGCESIIA